MSTLTIGDLDPVIVDALRDRTTGHGRTVEAEARHILSEAVAPLQAVGLAEAIRRRFAPFGGVDELFIPPREFGRDPPTFDP